MAAPTIQKNYIEASTHNGIVVEGFSSCPMIKANIIEANRKSGIKLVENARAHIGGQTLDDLNVTRSHLDFKEYANVYAHLFQNTGDDGSKDNMSTFYEVLEATAAFKEQVIHHLNNVDGQIKMGNLIHQNYSQGILIEEGCAADIIANHLVKNLKANIALGGQNSGDSKVNFNQIEKSKQEGIFVVEGEPDLQIIGNIIFSNFDGIVLLHSSCDVESNHIKQNDRCGMYLLSETKAKLIDNKISLNKITGIDIQDPSQPILKNNEIWENKSQIKLDKDVKRYYQDYQKDNFINGPNDLPQGLGCNIF